MESNEFIIGAELTSENIWSFERKKLNMTNEEFFSKIYNENYLGWWGNQSRSGHGSEGISAQQKIDLMKKIINKYEIKNILDIGCGDFNWMSKIPLIKYVGIDIVDEIISDNTEKYSNNNISFEKVNILKERDIINFTTKYNIKWDLVICFDIIGHLTNFELDKLFDFIIDTINVKKLIVTNKRDSYTSNILTEKTRNDGIDISIYPKIKDNFTEIFNEKNVIYDSAYYTLYEKK
jgi:SAM-dependent methyltransferase